MATGGIGEADEMQTPKLVNLGCSGHSGHGWHRQPSVLGSGPRSASGGAGFQAEREEKKAPFFNRKRDCKRHKSREDTAGRMLGLKTTHPSIF